MKAKLNAISMLCAIGTAALLAGCGGGSGDATTASAPGTPATTGTDTAPASAIDKLVGTYVSACAQDSGVTVVATGANAYKTVTLDYQKSSSTRASGTLQLAFFDTADCSGKALYTVKVSGDTYLTVDGTVTLDNKSVYKVTQSEGVLFPGLIFGGSLTLNSLKFTGAPYNQQTPQVAKDLMYVDDSGKVFGGDSSNRDAQGYPTALSSSPTPFTKSN